MSTFDNIPPNILKNKIYLWLAADGESYSEIGAILKISTKTARERVNDVRKAFAEWQNIPLDTLRLGGALSRKPFLSPQESDRIHEFISSINSKSPALFEGDALTHEDPPAQQWTDAIEQQRRNQRDEPQNEHGGRC